MKIIIGDVFESGADVIMHQVNCQGVMGSGVALQVKQKYPRVFEQYRLTCHGTEDKKRLLGEVLFVPTNNGTQYIANLFAQENFGYDGKCYTDYNALRKCLDSVNTSCVGKRVAIPYLMGCHRGGGDWNVVERLILETLKDCEVELYKYEG